MDIKDRKYDLEKGLDYEGYPLLKVYHLDQQKVVYIKRDGYYHDIKRMVNLEH